MTEALAAELDRRETEADADPDAGEAWPDIHGDLSKKLRYVRSLRVRKRTRREIEAIIAWYLQQSPSAAADFLAAVDAAMAMIADAPARYPLIRGRLRRVLLRRFP